MTKNKTLPSMRITPYTWEQMQLAIRKLNHPQIKKLSLADFRRLCLIFASKKILEGEQLNIELED